MNTAVESEGVVKFDLKMQGGPSPPAETVKEVLAWRAILWRLGLTAQDPQRYGGLAFGNISRRLKGNSFVISGTQTGGKQELSANDFCVVQDFDLTRNQISAMGPIAPSSEALTHAAVYKANATCQCVIHVHSPELWQHFKSGDLPATPVNAAYGTPEMASAAAALASGSPDGTFAMLGHVDGIVAFGVSPDGAALCLLRWLGIALTQSDGA